MGGMTKTCVVVLMIMVLSAHGRPRALVKRLPQPYIERTDTKVWSQIILGDEDSQIIRIHYLPGNHLDEEPVEAVLDYTKNVAGFYEPGEDGGRCSLLENLQEAVPKSATPWEGEPVNVEKSGKVPPLSLFPDELQLRCLGLPLMGLIPRYGNRVPTKKSQKKKGYKKTNKEEHRRGGGPPIPPEAGEHV